MNGGERLAACKKFVRVQLTQRAKILSEGFVLEHAAAAVDGVYPPRYPLPGPTHLDTLPRTVSTRAWAAAQRSADPPRSPIRLRYRRGTRGTFADS